MAGARLPGSWAGRNDAWKTETEGGRRPWWLRLCTLLVSRARSARALPNPDQTNQTFKSNKTLLWILTSCRRISRIVKQQVGNVGDVIAQFVVFCLACCIYCSVYCSICCKYEQVMCTKLQDFNDLCKKKYSFCFVCCVFEQREQKHNNRDETVKESRQTINKTQ